MKITDRQRLDFLQGLMRRRAKVGSFSGRVVECPLDSFLRVHDGGTAMVCLCDSGGRADDGYRRGAKTVRQAIDKAMRFHGGKTEST